MHETLSSFYKNCLNFHYIIFPFLSILSLLLFNRIAKHIFKTELLNTINSKLEPATIKNFEAIDGGNTLIYCKAMKKVGDIAKLENSNSNYIISSEFFFEFMSVPDKLFNVSKPKLEHIYEARDKKTCIKSLYYSKLLSSILSSKINKVSNGSNILLIKNLFENALNKYGTYRLDGTYEIENIFEFIQEAVVKKAIIQHFGKSAKNETGLESMFGLILSIPNTYYDKHLKIINKIRLAMASRKIVQYYKHLDNFVSKEISRRLIENQDEKIKYNDTIQVMIDSKKFNLAEIEPISHSIHNLASLEIIFMTQKLANFIIDISICPDVYSKLALEQKHIILKHGGKIGFKQLEQMEYLDAALFESSRLAEASSLSRLIEKDYVLSNGLTLKKKNFIKFGALTHSRNPVIYGENPHDFCPERNINRTKLSDISETNLMWGIGERMCPAREYNVFYLKQFATIFIREYEVLQHSYTTCNHLGYKVTHGISHVNRTLCLQPHDILHYSASLDQTLTDIE